MRVGGPTGEVKQTPRGRGSRSEREVLQVRQNRYPEGGQEGSEENQRGGNVSPIPK